MKIFASLAWFAGSVALAAATADRLAGATASAFTAVDSKRIEQTAAAEPAKATQQ